MPEIDEASAVDVVSDLRSLLEVEKDGELLASSWPTSIVGLRPERVYIADEGIYVVTSQFFTTETGFFLPKNHQHFRIKGGQDPKYLATSTELYKYRIKG